MYVSVSHSLIFPWTDMYKLIERLRFLGINGIGVNIKSVPKYFEFLGLNFTTPRCALLFLNSKIYIVHVINCEWSRSVNFPLRMFCMQYKHVFFQQNIPILCSNGGFKHHLKRTIENLLCVCVCVYKSNESKSGGVRCKKVNRIARN